MLESGSTVVGGSGCGGGGVALVGGGRVLRGLACSGHLRARHIRTLQCTSNPSDSQCRSFEYSGNH